MATPKKAAPGSSRARIAPACKEAEGQLTRHWRGEFLAALAETSNVTAAANTAGVHPSRAYKVRRLEQDFAAQWRLALYEGYEHLEMEVLAYLRGKAPEHKIDVANAIRLLAAHRDTVARMRAMEEDDDEQAVLDSIDAMIDAMRQRSQQHDAETEAQAESEAGRDTGAADDLG